MNILIPYLHYLGIMVLMGSLIAEHVILKPGLTRSQIRSLVTIDLIYWLSALLVLATGLIRWFAVDIKGADFFNTNPLFHIKVTLFVIVAILSIIPTKRFLKWARMAKTDEGFQVPAKIIGNQLLFLRIELFLMAIIPLLAVMVAAGVRM